MLSDIISEGLLGMSGEKSQAEVDYVVSHGGKVLPIEVRASTQGGMHSLWIFHRSHKLCDAVRTSLENFGPYSIGVWQSRGYPCIPAG